MCEYINDAIIQEDFTMEKTIYDKNNGLWYELRGDYYIPCLTVPAHEDRPIGIWGGSGICDTLNTRSAMGGAEGSGSFPQRL